MDIITRTEELILLTVWRLRDNAYGITIRKHLKDAAGLDYSIGGIYVPLDRLVRKGLLTSYQGNPTPQRGGMSKRFYKLTPDGIDALERIRTLNTIMWDNLPEPSF